MTPPHDNGAPGSLTIPIRRALLSVYDKTGIDDLARVLASFGCELISSGGTREMLGKAGIQTVDVSTVAGNPIAFDGRMKTISFGLASSLLFDRKRHAQEAEALGIAPIDMVVCTFYPFAEARAGGLTRDELVEYIDIGGPTMVRAAAKNARYVAVVTEPGDYPRIADELCRYRGALTLATRLDLMRKAFSLTADYDAAIAGALDTLAGTSSLRMTFESGRFPRYGENPHQRASVYRVKDAPHALADCPVLHGKELSYNNIIDVRHALEAVRDLPSHAVAVVKHTNSCGLATAPAQRRAFELAWQGDPVSAFGSVIAFNTPVERDTVAYLDFDHPDKVRRKFIEVVAAPAFTDDAAAYLKQHQNVRIMIADAHQLASDTDMRVVMNTLLIQETDRELFTNLSVMGTVTRQLDKPLVEFGLVAVRQVSSNAIAVVRRLADGACQLIGMGGGQPNRVCSVELAVAKCRENLARECPDTQDSAAYAESQLHSAVMVSDGFLPFPDNVDACARAGLRTIVQPGGSIRDTAVIQRADDHGVAMIFCGVRHFRH